MPEMQLGLVPEIYYDVIARLCAGAPFIAIVFWAYPAVRALPAVAFGVLAIFGSYLAGHLLAAVSAIWNPLLWNRWFLGRSSRNFFIFRTGSLAAHRVSFSM